MPYIKNHHKTPLVVGSSAGTGAGTTIEPRGLRSKNGVSEIGLRDWLAFRETWLGKHALAVGWIEETTEEPKPRTPENFHERDDDGPRAA